MKKFVWLLLLSFIPSFSQVQAQVCKTNQYDIMTWMLPWVSIQNSHYDVLYPSTGVFYWVKSSKGYPWDVDLFNEKFVYQSITEYLWSDPHTFKIFETPRAWAPRCINIPNSSGKLATIKHPASETWYDIHTTCSSFTRHNLLNAINEVWGPFTEQVGQLVPRPTLILSYRYGCDLSYNNCHDKETFELQHGLGLVRWTHYKLSGVNSSVETIVNQTVDVNPQVATVEPVHPCF